MKHLDLFSGIGGFALAASWVWGKEYECVGFCDIDQYCQRLLGLRFPGAKIYGDVRELKQEFFSGEIINLITAGYPCQPFSYAGQRRSTADERHLWPELLRVIREIRPRWVVAENVRGIINIGGGAGIRANVY